MVKKRFFAALRMTEVEELRMTGVVDHWTF